VLRLIVPTVDRDEAGSVTNRLHLKGSQMTEPFITREGLARLTEDLERLSYSGRREVAERIRDALSTDANSVENADYHSAREEHALLERRIAILQERISSAQLVEPDPSNGTVDVGERVLLRDLDTGEQVEFELVGSFESNPFEGRISVASPLGEALLGRRQGEIAIVDAPKGEMRFTIMAIDAPTSA
jgi:transcription elongation factor GreA